MPEWAGQFYPWAHLIGRILFAMAFVGSGWEYLRRLGGVSANASSAGVPGPRVMTAFTGIALVAGGLMVALGWRRFIGAGLIAIFLFLTAFMMHPFWKEPDPQARSHQRAHFMNDLALAGAALLIAYYAGWDWPFALGN